MGIFFLDENGEFQHTDNSVKIQVESFLQDISIWNGEQNFDIDNGVDWLGVLLGTVDPRIAITNIAQKYSSYFYVDNIEVSIDNNTKTVYINFTLTGARDINMAPISRELKVRTKYETNT